MIKSRVVELLFAVGVTLVSAGLCWGETALVLAGRGNGLFEVLGQGLEDVGGMDLTAIYDPTTLTDPRVGQRGLSYGAMMTPNLTDPGVVRIGIVTPKPEGIRGTGSIIMLTFSLLGGGPGQITSFTARLISTKGVTIPVRTQILADEKGRFPGNPFSGDPANPPVAITGTTGAAGSTTLSAGQPMTTPERSVPPGGMPAGLGAVSEPGSGDRALPPPIPIEPLPAAAELKRAPVNPPGIIELPLVAVTSGAPPLTEPPAPAASMTATAQPPRRNVVINKSVLTLVREYAGPRTQQALTTLFLRTSYPGFRQEPPIAFSDGVMTVKVFLAAAATGSQSPNFALAGGKLIAIKLNGGQYVLDIIPEAGVVETTVTVLGQGSLTDYPLVVAPSLDAKTVPGGAFDEAGFALFLKNAGGTPGDLNGDGRRDYLDEYIYTANYLVKGGKK